MNLGILTLIHGREQLTRKVCDYYARIISKCSLNGVHLDLTAAASLEDTWAMHIPAWKVRFIQNQPLTDKWHFGLQYFKERDVDAVMIIGSDNIVHWSTLCLAAELCTEANPYWMPAGIFYVNDKDGRLMGGNEKDVQIIYRAFRRCGAGRILHRSLIDKLEWRLWKLGHTAGTDGAMDKVVEDVEMPKRYGGTVVDIKTDVNMWSYEHMTRPGLYAPADLELIEAMISPEKGGTM